MSETTFSRDAWLLGNEALPNFEAAGLSQEVIAFHREHKDQIIPAIRRGFVLPGTITPSAVSVETVGYPIEETDCFQWLGHMEKFAKDYFKAKVTLRDMFPLPARLPWKQVLPIFNPGLTNREMVDKALKSRKLSVYESVDVMKYCGSGASAPGLCIIERFARPTLSTMGLPPKFAKNWFAGRQTVPLNLCGYGIGMSLWHEVEEQFLDPQTATWFPGNTLSDGDVAYGDYDPGCGKVEFFCNDSDDEYDSFGFREAICLKPKA